MLQHKENVFPFWYVNQGAHSFIEIKSVYLIAANSRL